MQKKHRCMEKNSPNCNETNYLDLPCCEQTNPTLFKVLGEEKLLMGHPLADQEEGPEAASGGEL